MTNKKLVQRIAVAESTLRKKKQQIADEEHLSEARHAVKSFRLSYLGENQRNCGGPQGRKRREEVLDRLARLGTGLSPGQRNEWAWFKEAWQVKMLDEHGENWVRTFAGWMQEVLDKLARGQANAFAVFVHSETRRCFSDEVALTLPGLH